MIGRLKTYDFINGVYTIKVEGDFADKFLERRDSFRNTIVDSGDTYENATRRADTEFAEYALSYLLPPEVWKSSDKIEVDGFIYNIPNDFKIWANTGVKVGKTPQRWAKEGLIHFFTVWKWSNNNRHTEILRGNEYSFEVVGSYLASVAINSLYKDEKGSERFFTDLH